MGRHLEDLSQSKIQYTSDQLIRRDWVLFFYCDGPFFLIFLEQCLGRAYLEGHRVENSLRPAL